MNFNNNEFALQTETPSEAILRLALAKEDNREKFGGPFWTKQRADGRYAILATIVDCTNIKFQGRTLKSEKLIDTNVELRITEEDLEALQEATFDMTARIVELKVNVVGDMILKELTLKDGTATRNVYLFGSIEGVREGSSNLSSDTFESEEDIYAFLGENQSKNRAGRDAYRAAQQMASTMQENANALA